MRPLAVEVLSALFGRHFAETASNPAWRISFYPGKEKSLIFAVGQPLGMYASWPLFALSHHILVWHCANQIDPGERFSRYAILGDDIVICDDRVAREYTSMLDDLQVKISLSKSVVSNTGRVC